MREACGHQVGDTGSFEDRGSHIISITAHAPHYRKGQARPLTKASTLWRRLQHTTPSTSSPNRLRRTLTPHSIIHGECLLRHAQSENRSYPSRNVRSRHAPTPNRACRSYPGTTPIL